MKLVMFVRHPRDTRLQLVRVAAILGLRQLRLGQPLLLLTLHDFLLPVILILLLRLKIPLQYQLKDQCQLQLRLKGQRQRRNQSKV